MDSQLQSLIDELSRQNAPNSITPQMLANLLNYFASKVHFTAETITSLTGSGASSTLPAAAALLNTVKNALSAQITNHTHASTDLSNQQQICFGKDNNVTGLYAAAVNRDNSAAGNNAFVEGYGNSASGNQSHAEGNGTVASAPQSHAEGWGTKATNNGAHAEGDETVASGKYSHAEGESCESRGDYSHAEGLGNIAAFVASHVCGKYATIDSSGTLIFQVGIGTSASQRVDAITIDRQGNITVHHNPTAALHVATKQYVDNLISSLTSRIEALESANQ